MTERNESLIDRALEFAKQAHGEQKRKYTGEPYWTHPLAVSQIVSQFTSDEGVIAAAILHDVVEDTAATAADICAAFGERVALLVLEVTDVSRPEDGNRAQRKEIDRIHLTNSSCNGATIKLADLLDNTSSIVQHDKKFAPKYLQEKMAVLQVLKHGNRALWERAAETVMIAIKELAA